MFQKPTGVHGEWAAGIAPHPLPRTAGRYGALFGRCAFPQLK